MWKPDRGPVSTIWMIVLVISFFSFFGYMSGFVETGPNYSKSLRPFEWGDTQIYSTVILGVCWLGSMFLSWKYSEEMQTKIGAMIVSSLPQILTLFFLTGLVSPEFN